MKKFSFTFTVYDDGRFGFEYKTDDPDAVRWTEILGALEAAKMDVVNQCVCPVERGAEK